MRKTNSILRLLAVLLAALFALSSGTVDLLDVWSDSAEELELKEGKMEADGEGKELQGKPKQPLHHWSGDLPTALAGILPSTAANEILIGGFGLATTHSCPRYLLFCSLRLNAC